MRLVLLLIHANLIAITCCPIKRTYIYLYTSLSLRTRTKSAANDDRWHHLCLVWKSEGGKVTIHNDKEVLPGSKFSEGEKIPGMSS